jgi:hypothetical protein
MLLFDKRLRPKTTLVLSGDRRFIPIKAERNKILEKNKLPIDYFSINIEEAKIVNLSAAASAFLQEAFFKEL